VAEVDVRIGGRKYELACRDGDEDRLRVLAGLVDSKAIEAARAMGGLNETRQLLFAALLLADELSEELAKTSAATPPVSPASSAIDDEVAVMVVEELANRVEALAARLENGLAKP
jgi:cell division protein ZapA